MCPVSRSATSALPSGRNASPHGVVRPVATVSGADRSGVPEGDGAVGGTEPPAADAGAGTATLGAGAGAGVAPLPLEHAASTAVPAAATDIGRIPAVRLCCRRRLVLGTARRTRPRAVMRLPCHAGVKA